MLEGKILYSGRGSQEQINEKRVCFCIPTITKPFDVTMRSLAASVKLIEESRLGIYDNL